MRFLELVWAEFYAGKKGTLGFVISTQLNERSTEIIMCNGGVRFELQRGTEDSFSLLEFRHSKKRNCSIDQWLIGFRVDLQCCSQRLISLI